LRRILINGRVFDGLIATCASTSGPAQNGLRDGRLWSSLHRLSRYFL